LERNWKSMYRRIKVIPYLSPVKTINSKWNKNLGIEPKTVK
jgi:hypothetical protein